MCFPDVRSRTGICLPSLALFPPVSLSLSLPISSPYFAILCVSLSSEGREKNSGTREAYDNWRFRRTEPCACVRAWVRAWVRECVRIPVYLRARENLGARMCGRMRVRFSEGIFFPPYTRSADVVPLFRTIIHLNYDDDDGRFLRVSLSLSHSRWLVINNSGGDINLLHFIRSPRATSDCSRYFGHPVRMFEGKDSNWRSTALAKWFWKLSCLLITQISAIQINCLVE